MAERDDLWQVIYNADGPFPCPHYAHRQRAGWDVCAECEADAIYEAVIKHLTAAGRLLPSGGEVSTIWGLRRGKWVEHVGYGSGSELLARQAAADGHGELVRQDTRTWPDESQYIGPWSPVVSDNSEGESSG